MNNNSVIKCEIEKANVAIRKALKYASEKSDVFQLANLTKALKEITFAADYILEDDDENINWDELKEQTTIRSGLRFHATSEFIPANH